MNNYKRLDEKSIEITTDYFDILAIVESGQLFRYKIFEDYVLVISKDFSCKVSLTKPTIIESQNIEYFINYFDLNSDYSQICNKLSEIVDKKLWNEVFNFSKGVRLLKQDKFETVISFIISANNNIKRIQKIIANISEKFGSKVDDFYAFPTLCQLKTASTDDFLSLGAGYRAKYLSRVCNELSDLFFEEVEKSDTSVALKQILKLSGVGPKVADCILLFAFSRFDVFPVDTWIEKIYNLYFCDGKKLHNRNLIRQLLIQKFDNLSGYIQQYLFYYERLKK